MTVCVSVCMCVCVCVCVCLSLSLSLKCERESLLLLLLLWERIVSLFALSFHSSLNQPPLRGRAALIKRTEADSAGERERERERKKKRKDTRRTSASRVALRTQRNNCKSKGRDKRAYKNRSREPVRVIRLKCFYWITCQGSERSVKEKCKCTCCCCCCTRTACLCTTTTGQLNYILEIVWFFLHPVTQLVHLALIKCYLLSLRDNESKVSVSDQQSTSGRVEKQATDDKSIFHPLGRSLFYLLLLLLLLVPVICTINRMQSDTNCCITHKLQRVKQWCSTPLASLLGFTWIHSSVYT